MPRTKQRKVGDRIFFQDFNGDIATALITEIKDAEYTVSSWNGDPLEKGTPFKFKFYKTNEYSGIEDYNCLSESDPRVIEFCKGKTFITKEFVDELRKFLKEKGCHKGDPSVSQILYSLAEEYE